MKKMKPQSAQRARSSIVNGRHEMISNQLRQAISWFLILLAFLPGGSVQAAEDTAWALLSQVQPGVNYDPGTQSWFFYGVPIEQVRYVIPGAGVDLVRVLFIGRDGFPYKVWVALGMEMYPTGYVALGPWESPEQVYAIRLKRTLLKVYISGTTGRLMPRVDEQGIRWENCSSNDPCSYGQLFDAMHNDLSNLFIDYEIGPGWYPWGFLFWDVEIVAQDENLSTKDTKEHEVLFFPL